MNAEELVRRLVEGTTLEGPHWTEPVKVLTAKARGSRIEVQAVGLHTKRLWTKLLKPDEFDGAIKVTQAGRLAALNGNPTHFRLAAEAHRIRLAFQYDPHFAVSVSQVDPLPHQMDAVYTHLLTQPRIRFLIADDPGAGKTIMGGLTIKELKFRGLVERTLIVTPANLTDQWRRELHDKFNESFTVINRGTVSATYGRNVWEDNPQCITSIDFVARQDDILNLLRDVRWDLVIVDEAHKMAAYRYGTKVNKTQRYEFGEFLREKTDHYLFLTATPHKGDPDNFALLLQLLDRDLYVNGNILAEASAHDENRIMIRRLKEDMKKFDNSPCFPPRHVKTLPYKLSPDELKLYEAVTDYVQNNFQRAAQAENMAELEAEIEELDRLVKLARHTERNVPETKFEELRSVISEHLSGKLERLLVFTEHKDTLDFLVGRLTNLGFHCCTIHGGMALEKRIAAEREFFERKPSVMVATEAAGEGINLQFCSLMVNYDIPWNPNRLEQRMGRIHRYGQQHEAMIYNLVAKNTREGEVMDRLLHKLDDMRKALGSDRVYDVVGEIIPGPRFDALMKDWLSRRRTMAEILAEIDLQTDPEQVARIKADMEDKALGSRHIDLSKLLADQQQSKEHRLMPEYIERFFVEAYRSFGGTIVWRHVSNVPKEGHEDRHVGNVPPRGYWSISRVPPDLRKLPDHLERKYGKVGNAYPQITFDKEQVVGYTDLEFVGPGHPLFEGVVERVLHEYGSSLRQGAVFYNADATEPTVLWLLKCGVEDGRGHPVGERLFAIHLTAGRFRKSQPYALLDLKAPEREPALAGEVRQAAADEDRTIEWSLEEVTTVYFKEIADRRTRELAIREKYVRKSLQFLISESAKKIAKYDTQLRQLRDETDPKRLSLQGNRAQEEARRSELSQRLKDRLAEIEQERHLSEKPPEVVGVAVILPPPKELIAGVEGMQSDPEIERIAVEVAKQYEISQGRKPISVEEENCGWDLTSLAAGQVSRYIEVKGRASEGGVALTPNEWIKAQRFGKDYWLYVVVNCATKPELYLIQDPASKLSPKEEVSVVRYVVGQQDWKRASTGV